MTDGTTIMVLEEGQKCHSLMARRGDSDESPRRPDRPVSIWRGRQYVCGAENRTRCPSPEAV